MPAIWKDAVEQLIWTLRRAAAVCGEWGNTAALRSGGRHAKNLR